MCKKSLTGEQMSSLAYVQRAACLSRELTRMRTRGPGDIENAMRAIERDYGIDYSVAWRLRYRLSQCKSICASVYARIESAYIAECERQERKLAHERQIANTIARSLVATCNVGLGNEATEASLSENVGTCGK